MNQTPTSKNHATRGTLTKGKNPEDCTAQPPGEARGMGLREGRAHTKGKPKAGGETPQEHRKSKTKERPRRGQNGK